MKIINGSIEIFQDSDFLDLCKIAMEKNFKEL